MKKLILTAFLCCACVCQMHGELDSKYRTNFRDVVKHSSSSERELNCLTFAVYREAGAESDLGKAAVARVIINRMNLGIAPTVCKVLAQPHQFSFTFVKLNLHVNNNQWQDCARIASAVLDQNDYNDILPKTALYFNGTNGIKFNSRRFKLVATIGNQRFYSRKIKII